ncbi:MAG: GDCCVxC domain-containing (seleno)protein [Ktedonobacterales bacterium]
MLLYCVACAEFRAPVRLSHMPVVTRSVIRCARCEYEREVTMPTAYCQIVYECPRCGARLSPKAGDCCVFCSYGSVPCPSMQAGARGGAVAQDSATDE